MRLYYIFLILSCLQLVGAQQEVMRLGVGLDAVGKQKPKKKKELQDFIGSKVKQRKLRLDERKRLDKFDPVIIDTGQVKFKQRKLRDVDYEAEELEALVEWDSIKEEAVEAFNKGDLDTFRELLDSVGASKEATFAEESLRDSQLKAAIESGDVALLEKLLDRKNIPKEDLPEKLSALLVEAVLEKQVAIAQLLLERGANINYNDKQPLLIAIRDNNMQMINFFLDQPEIAINPSEEGHNSPLYYAVMEKNLDILELLIEHGADVNADDFSAFNEAIYQKDLRIIGALLHHGANLNVPDDMTWTPLFRAAETEAPEVIRYLFLHGANPRIQNITTGQTPLENMKANIEKIGADLTNFVENWYEYWKKLIESPNVFIVKLNENDISEVGVPRVDILKRGISATIEAEANNWINPDTDSFRQAISKVKQVFNALSRDELEELVRGYKPSVLNKPMVDFLIEHGFITTEADLFKGQKIKEKGSKTQDLGFKFK